MRILMTTLLVMGVAFAGEAAVHPDARSDAAIERPPVRLAKRRRRRGPKVPVEPVRVRSASSELQLKQRNRLVTVYKVTPDLPLTFEVTGPGKLAVVIHQLLPKGKKSKRRTFLVSVDGKRPAAVKVTNKPYRKGRLEGSDAPASNSKKRLERLKGGKHQVEVTAPATSAGGIVLIEMYVTGSRTAAPVVLEPSKLAEEALEALEEDEPPSGPAPPPPPAEPPPVPVAEAPPPELPAEPATADPVAELAQRLTSGEIRDGLVGEYPPATVIDEDSGERIGFHRVGAEESFSFMVQGPGEAIVRLHRLVGPGTKPGDEYKIVILENDVLLQQLDGKTEILERRKLEAPVAALAAPALSDAKEYRLKVGPNQSRFAFQIAQASEGMVIRYEFAAEEMSLAAMALDFDEEDDDEGIGLGTGNAMPTVVMEVDVTEKTRTIVVEQPKGFLGLAVYAGSMIPVAGGDMGMVGAAEISIALPWLDRAFLVAAEGTFIRHGLAASAPDPAGAAIDAVSTVYAVPIVGKFVARLRLAEIFSLYASGGFGVSYVRAERTALGANTVAVNWLWTARGSGGFELELGPGALVVDTGYLYAPTADFGTSLQGYTPTGPVFSAGYRLGL